MKIKQIAFLSIAIIALSLSSYASARELPGPEEVTVKKLDAPLPNNEDEMHRYLWGKFANKPEENKFSGYSTDKLEIGYGLFVKALIKKAEGQKLDSKSLEKALDLMLENSKNKPTYLPVGAYQTTLNGNPVWIVIVKWGSGKEGLGHIRIYVFDQKTLKQVGYVTCR